MARAGCGGHRAVVRRLKRRRWRRWLLARVGCNDARSVSHSSIPLLDAQIEAKIGMVGFRSVTMRAFKLPLEDRCEDYGQVATYRGSIAGLPHAFVLDDHHRFETGRPMLVSGNTFDMLARSRYADHFTLAGDSSVHHGCSSAPARRHARPSRPAADLGAKELCMGWIKEPLPQPHTGSIRRKPAPARHPRCLA